MQAANNSLDLFVSYKSQPFVNAQFNTDLSRKDYHIADVSYDRIFVSVSHTETLANLYISEVIDHRGAKFILSLPNIMTFFPNSTWKDSWLKLVQMLLLSFQYSSHLHFVIYQLSF